MLGVSSNVRVWLCEAFQKNESLNVASHFLSSGTHISPLRKQSLLGFENQPSNVIFVLVVLTKERIRTGTNIKIMGLFLDISLMRSFPCLRKPFYRWLQNKVLICRSDNIKVIQRVKPHIEQHCQPLNFGFLKMFKLEKSQY